MEKTYNEIEMSIVKEMMEGLEEAMYVTPNILKMAIMLYDMGVDAKDFTKKEYLAAKEAMDGYYESDFISHFISEDILDIYTNAVERK